MNRAESTKPKDKMREELRDVKLAWLKRFRYAAPHRAPYLHEDARLDNHPISTLLSPPL